MNDVCGYIQWAEQAQLTLKFNITSVLRQACLALGDTDLYSVGYGLDELWKLGSF